MYISTVQVSDSHSTWKILKDKDYIWICLCYLLFLLGYQSEIQVYPLSNLLKRNISLFRTENSKCIHRNITICMLRMAIYIWSRYSSTWYRICHTFFTHSIINVHSWHQSFSCRPWRLIMLHSIITNFIMVAWTWTVFLS